MQKKILAMAVAGAFAAAPALASADDSVTLYGQVKYEVGAIDGSDVAGSGNRDLTHSTMGSRLGIRGSEDLGGGLTGIFRIQGNFGGAGDTFGDELNTGEETWVGVDGNFGQVRLGRSDTAMKNAMKPFRAFTDTLADFNSRPGRVGWDGVNFNSWQRADGIHYQSPDFAGFTFGATLEPVGEKTDTYYALNAIYEMGPMQFSGAYETQTSTSDGYGDLDNERMHQDIDSWHAGFSFDFGQGDVGVKYHLWDGDSGAPGMFDDNKLEQVVVPANFRVTDQINLRAAIQYNSWDDGETLVDEESSWTNVAFGAQYHFSNRTEAFVNIWNDGVSGVTATNGGGDMGALSDDSTHVGVGLRHSF